MMAGSARPAASDRSRSAAVHACPPDCLRPNRAAMSVNDAANPAQRERRKLLLELCKPHCIGLPLGPVMLLQSGEKLGLDPLRAGPLIEQLACDLILDLKVRQGREHIRQLGQEVLRVDWDLGRMDEGFRADKGAWHRQFFVQKGCAEIPPCPKACEANFCTGQKE